MTAARDLTVDIVVNNFNYGRFLPLAISSACNQTHEKVSVIVVDDGSTDESRRLLEDAPEGVEVVLKENGGQASAMNVGLSHCHSDVVMFLDSDDVLRPDAAARMAAIFSSDPEIAKVQARMEVIDAEGRATGVLKPPEHIPMPAGNLRRAELSYPFDLTWLPTTANAFRADALRRIFPIPEESFRVGADYYLVHLTSLLGRVVSLEEIHSSYRLHGANNYEPQRASLDLAHLRATILLSNATSEALLRVAAQEGLSPPERILSLADLSNRMVSLCLEPRLHPLKDDTRRGLVLAAIRACRRRDNISVAMKAMFIAWFAAMAVLPRGLAHPLADRFLFPENRVALNRLLARLHRSGASPATAR